SRNVSLWPVVLIALGLALLGAALPWGRRPPLQQSEERIALDGATRGRVVVEYGGGRLVVGLAASVGVLVEGPFAGPPDISGRGGRRPGPDPLGGGGRVPGAGGGVVGPGRSAVPARRRRLPLAGFRSGPEPGRGGRGRGRGQRPRPVGGASASVRVPVGPDQL